MHVCVHIKSCGVVSVAGLWEAKNSKVVPPQVRGEKKYCCAYLNNRVDFILFVGSCCDIIIIINYWGSTSQVRTLLLVDGSTIVLFCIFRGFIGANVKICITTRSSSKSQVLPKKKKRNEESVFVSSQYYIRFHVCFFLWGWITPTLLFLISQKIVVLTSSGTIYILFLNGCNYFFLSFFSFFLLLINLGSICDLVQCYCQFDGYLVILVSFTSATKNWVVAFHTHLSYTMGIFDM